MDQMPDERREFCFFDMQEEWRDIKGYEGLYQVSDLGRIKSLNKVNKGKDGILSPKGKGYKFVELHRKGDRKPFYIHRLVAMMFIEKEDGKEYVDHINGDRYDNRACNLKWVTASENYHNPITRGRYKENIKNRKNRNMEKSTRVIDDITLINADCLKAFEYMPEGSVDCVITDLPYNVLNKSNPSVKWDKEIDMSKMWKQIWRVLKQNGACILFGQGLFSAKLIMSNSKNYRYSLIWNKCRTSGFLNANRMPLRQHEDILVFYRSLPTYNPQMTKCEPHERNHSRGSNPKNSNRCYGNFQALPSYISDEKHPTSIISIPKEHINGKFYHPTCKPVALLEWLIKTYSNEGETILDFTMGSGSTMVACVNTNRKGVGIELMQEYYDIAVKRVQEAIMKSKNLFNL